LAYNINNLAYYVNNSVLLTSLLASILASHAQLQAQTQLMAAYENRLDPTAPQQHIDYNLQMLISTETITHGIPLVF